MPLTEPVTLSEARKYMRLDDDETFDDSVISLLISAQRLHMEKQLGVWLVQRATTENYRKPCCGIIGSEFYSLKYGPVSGDVIIKDIQNNPVTLDNYGSAEWPEYRLTYGVDFAYTAGYEEIPEDLKLALLMNIATAYESRENSTNDTVNEVKNASRKLSGPYSRNVF